MWHIALQIGQLTSTYHPVCWQLWSHKTSYAAPNQTNYDNCRQFYRRHRYRYSVRHLLFWVLTANLSQCHCHCHPYFLCVMAFKYLMWSLVKQPSMRIPNRGHLSFPSAISKRSICVLFYVEKWCFASELNNVFLCSMDALVALSILICV